MASIYEYAAIAADVYDNEYRETANNEILIQDGWQTVDTTGAPPVPGEDLIKGTNNFVTTPEGFGGALYTNGTEYVIAYRGTDFITDLDDDIEFGTGVPDQFWDAWDFYLQALQFIPEGASLTFVGHSLGGGLATMVSQRVGAQAVVIDPAPAYSATEIVLGVVQELETVGQEVTVVRTLPC